MSLYILRSRESDFGAAFRVRGTIGQKVSLGDQVLALRLVLLDQLLGVLARVDGRRIQFSSLQMQLRRLFVLHAGGLHFRRHFEHAAGAGTVRGTALHIHRIVHRIAEVSVLITDVVQIVLYVERLLQVQD